MKKIFLIIICLILFISNSASIIEAIENDASNSIENEEIQDEVNREDETYDSESETFDDFDDNDGITFNESGEFTEEKINDKSMESNTDEVIIKDVKSTEAFTLSVNTDQNKIIKQYEKDNIIYLFLTSDINISELKINYTGNIDSVSNIDGEIDKINKVISIDCTNNMNFEITLSDGSLKQVAVMQSDLPSLYVELNDVTLDKIHQDKEIKYKNNSVYLTTGNINDSTYNLTQIGNVEIKGRGNTTWGGADKKPYQIKFDEKIGVLGMGAAKKWVLLANAFDASLMKNNIGFTLADKLGLETSEFRYIDLWIDGEYLGNYLICEKVEIGKSRLNLTDENGILVELDNAYYMDEDVYGSTNSGKKFVLKESVADDTDSINSIAKNSFYKFVNEINKFEDGLFNKKLSWSDIQNIIDVEDFVNYYILNEFVYDVDGLNSSVYLYKDGDGDKIHIGPVWDFDSGMGGRTAGLSTDTLSTLDVKYSASLNYYSYLFGYDEFVKMVNNKWEQIADEFKNLGNYIDDQSQKILKSAEMNYIRWDYLGKVVYPIFNRFATTYSDSCNELKQWAMLRYSFLNSWLQPTKIICEPHIQDIGWQKNTTCAQVTGTTGKDLRLEAIKLKINNSQYDGNIEYSTHVENIGWQNWVSNNEIAGTVGESKRVEAIKIKLTGEIANIYDIYYRVHIQDFGWLDWAKNGNEAGSAGYSKRLEAIQIVLVEKDVVAPGKMDKPYIQRLINYSTHIQDYGWQERKYDGTLSGTEGQSKRLEGIKISFDNPRFSGDIKYRTHVQDIGWQNWVINGALAGTTGQAKRLEAIEITLTGQMSKEYDVYYRVHIQDFGWLDWACNGQSAGSEGLSKRLEAIEIKLIAKGNTAPGNTQKPFYN